MKCWRHPDGREFEAGGLDYARVAGGTATPLQMRVLGYELVDVEPPEPEEFEVVAFHTSQGAWAFSYEDNGKLSSLGVDQVKLQVKK